MTDKNILAAQWSQTPRLKNAFETPPPPIPHGVITREIQADVIVIGAGFAGLCAAAAAAESGARTILIEKAAAPGFRGLRIGAVADQVQREAGIRIDRQEIIAEMMRWSAYKADQRLVTLWVDESGAALDWVYDQISAAGIEPGRIPLEGQVPLGRSFTYYPITNLNLEGGLGQLSKILENAAIAAGADLYFNIRAVQLEQSSTGQVLAVIAQEADGAYTRYAASKGVILCTGDYGHDPEMVHAYAPHAERTFWNLYMPPTNTGDGHKLGLWAGGQMDEAPHCALIFDIAVIDSPRPMLFPLGRQPFLNVNLRGERYVNEELPFAFTCRADAAQPGGCKWVIWDDKWREDTQKFGSIICKSMESPIFQLDDLAFLLDKGIIKVADTIAELAEKIEVPAATLGQTVARYSMLARNGADIDFGKVASCMSTIEQAPFYALKMGPALLVTLGGLKIDTQLRVLDEAGDPIEGLYAAGNASGGFFGSDYPINVSGISHGRAVTFGRLAGKSAASRQPAGLVSAEASPLSGAESSL